MDFHVMTLFPDMIMDGLNTSITGRAIKAGVMSVKAYDIREYSNDKHLKVDDYPYGGGAGMVMRAAPVCDCYEDIVRNIGKRPRVVYMTPQGYTFTQSMAEEFAKEDNLVILCGHYEGIDERALENIVTDFVSIGDYGCVADFKCASTHQAQGVTRVREKLSRRGLTFVCGR